MLFITHGCEQWPITLRIVTNRISAFANYRVHYKVVITQRNIHILYLFWKDIIREFFYWKEVMNSYSENNEMRSL